MKEQNLPLNSRWARRTKAAAEGGREEEEETACLVGFLEKKKIHLLDLKI